MTLNVYAQTYIQKARVHRIWTLPIFFFNFHPNLGCECKTIKTALHQCIAMPLHPLSCLIAAHKLLQNLYSNLSMFCLIHFVNRGWKVITMLHVPFQPPVIGCLLISDFPMVFFCRDLRTYIAKKNGLKSSLLKFVRFLDVWARGKLWHKYILGQS